MYSDESSQWAIDGICDNIHSNPQTAFSACTQFSPLCLTWHVLPRTVLSRVDMLLIILFPPLGEYDHLPEVAFYMVGDISEAVAKAERLAEEVQ